MCGGRMVQTGHLGAGLASLRLKVLKGDNAPPIDSVAIELPRGLTFRRGRAHGRAVTRVHITGARVTYVRLVRGRLLIGLSPAVRAITIQVQGIREAATLKRRAKHHRLRVLTLGVGITDASGRGTLLRVVGRALHL
jgi:hypothetical protein